MYLKARHQLRAKVFIFSCFRLYSGSLLLGLHFSCFIASTLQNINKPDKNAQQMVLDANLDSQVLQKT